MKTLALAAFGAALLAAGAAQAAPQAIGSLYQEQVSATCNNTTNCQLGFATIAADQALLVQTIDCRISTPSNLTVFQVALTDFGQGIVAGRQSVPVVATPSTSGSSFRNWVGSVQTSVFYSGARPWVNMYANVATNFNAICTISGVRKPKAQW